MFGRSLLSLSSVDVRAFNVSKTYAQFIHMHKSLEPQWALWTVSRVFFLLATPLLLSCLLCSTIVCKLMCSAHTPFKHQYTHIYTQLEQSRAEWKTDFRFEKNLYTHTFTYIGERGREREREMNWFTHSSLAHTHNGMYTAAAAANLWQILRN